MTEEKKCVKLIFSRHERVQLPSPIIMGSEKFPLESAFDLLDLIFDTEEHSVILVIV